MINYSKMSFSGHETFVFRYSWLKKAVDTVSENPSIFNQEDVIVSLGLGRNMVKSLRHWGLATRVLEEETKARTGQLRCTELGRVLFCSIGDPYLEDPNTLWILHWNLLANIER